HTLVPSVTGEGVDWFCFRCIRLPPPSGFCQRRVPLTRSTHHRGRLGDWPRSGSASPTLRKMRSPQMIGVDPDSAGMGSFQDTFSAWVHFTGRFFSVLMPFCAGPRHCGQFSVACKDATPHASSIAMAVRLRIYVGSRPTAHHKGHKDHEDHKEAFSDLCKLRDLAEEAVGSSIQSARSAATSGARSAARVAMMDDTSPAASTARTRSQPPP